MRQTTDRDRRPSIGSAVMTGCLTALVVTLLVLGALAYGAVSWLGGTLDSDLSAIGTGIGYALALLAVAAGQAVTGAWAYNKRPGRAAIITTQAPYVAAWALALAWWATDLPLYVIPWATGSLVALSWLLVWWLPARTDRRRAMLAATGAAVLLALNAAGVGLMVWRTTNGFGLVGQPNPWTAVTTLAATSCLPEIRFHWDGNRVVEAACPEGPDADYYAGAYDQAGFDNTLCAEQPRTAFAQWWEWNRKYELEFTLEYTIKSATVDGKEVPKPFPLKRVGDDDFPADIDGENATVMADVRLLKTFHLGTDDPYRVEVNSDTESWVVHLKSTNLGGWKVCQIDVTNAIKPNFVAL